MARDESVALSTHWLATLPWVIFLAAVATWICRLQRGGRSTKRVPKVTRRAGKSRGARPKEQGGMSPRGDDGVDAAVNWLDGSKTRW